ncbi:MAG: DNA mismatch repair endonuclease MutL [Armatimonadetes bacterium]|nr:DNA mismatch repair endonuclease MutL [Armatimonadota bacterium]
MSPVRLLDEQTANQIAAGEVVERPAAAVKELIENALDAGSTRIFVEVEDGGRALIRITDNGFGMAPEDAEMALQRHATSKITSADDLTRLRTLGFRGEALPSIASISHFELVTRPPESAAALRLYLEGGTILERGEAGAPPGTRITVRHLFYNTPARLKFIKSITTEMNHIAEIAGRLAMAHPHVAVRLMHNGREVFSTPGTGQPRDTLAALWGRDRAAALLEAASESPAVNVSGFVSPPEHSRPNRGHQAFFVNGRPIVSRLLSHALDHTFRPLIPDGRFPAGAIFLAVPPEDVDVNVHPSKTEVRFRNEREIHSAITRAVRAALMQVPEITRTDTGTGDRGSGIGNSGLEAEGTAGLIRPDLQQRLNLSPDRFLPDTLLKRTGLVAPVWQGIEPEEEEPRPPGSYYAPSPYAAPPHEPSDGEAEVPPAPSPGSESPSPSADDPFATTEAAPDPTPNAQHPTPNTQRSTLNAQSSTLPDLLSGMRLLGQVMNTFLVGEGRDGLLLIDQHVAHERILYDRLMRARNGQRAPEVQRLLLPITVTLSGQEAAALETRLPELEKLGFEVEPFGGDTFIVRALPVGLSHKNPETILRDLAAELREEWGPGRSVMEKAVDAVIASASCHGAIKANMPLSPTEMQRLVEDLMNSDDPYRCPHGRPTVMQITKGELYKWFKRTG